MEYLKLMRMKRYKVTFIKMTKVLAPGQSQLIYLAEQIYYSENPVFDIQVPTGFQVGSVTEYLPDVNATGIKKLPTA